MLTFVSNITIIDAITFFFSIFNYKNIFVVFIVDAGDQLIVWCPSNVIV